MIIGFVGEKGGPGKTALCLNTAVCLTRLGHEVVLIDADRQRSTADWAEQREVLARVDNSLKSIVCVERMGDCFDTIESLSRKYAFVVVDVSGADTPQMASVLMAADRVFSPFVPSACDLKTAQTMNHQIEITRLRGNPELRALAVLNQVSPRSHEAKPELELAREMLEPFTNLPLAEHHLSFRKTYRRAYALSRGVVELADSHLAKERDAHGSAAREFWSLFTEVTGLAPKDTPE